MKFLMKVSMKNYSESFTLEQNFIKFFVTKCNPNPAVNLDVVVMLSDNDRHLDGGKVNLNIDLELFTQPTDDK